MPMGAELTVQVIEDPPTIRLDGEVDLSTVAEFRSAVDHLSEKREGLAVDLSKVSFIDSTGLGLICDTALKLDGESPLVLRNPSRMAVKVLEIFGAHSIPALKIESK